MTPDVIGGGVEAGAKLAQYGATGVAIAALLICAVLGWLFSKAMQSQSKEHREAMLGLHNSMKETLDRNTAALQDNAKATAQLSGSLPHVCRFNR